MAKAVIAVASGLAGFVLGAASLALAHHKAGHGDGKEPAASAPAAASAGRPAYLVVLGEVRDREKFMSEYTAKLPPVYAKFGGEYLAAGRTFDVLEGEGAFKSFVISKWPSMEAGRAFWTSAEYDALRRARIAGDWGRFDVFLLEGLPPAQ